MKLEVDLETDHEERIAKYACLRHALDKIEGELSEGKGAGSFQHFYNSYYVDWRVEED